MRLYHFLKRGYGLEAIRERHLKIARLSALNDPFEFLSFAMTDPDDREVFEHWRNMLDIGHGLLCFSESPYNPVQWSHYAENHTGACLGFDVPDNKLFKVQYKAKRGNVDIRATVKAGAEASWEMMQAALATKYAHWEYEKEWRTFVGLDHSTAVNGLYFMDFGPNLVLKQVIVGSKSTITRAEVAEALGDMAGVETFKARLAYQTFSVVKNQNPALWK